MFSTTSVARRFSTLAASGALALLVLTGSTSSAAAPPDSPDRSAGVSSVEPGADSPPCFLVRSHWNVALDGFQPLC